MALDFQQVRQQVLKLGELAPQRARELKTRREAAQALFESYAGQEEALRQKTLSAVKDHEQNLRCALPALRRDGTFEALNFRGSLPGLPERATILAADGSQINPDRHAAVEYCLVNVGAIWMQAGETQPPQTSTQCNLYYAEEAENLTEARLALRRDLAERTILAEQAQGLPGPVITFTDGPMELYGGRERDQEAISEFQQTMEKYLGVLDELCRLKAATAGYIDQPGANLVMRLLEVAMAAPEDLPNLKSYRPLRGVRDRELFAWLLAPGERSAVYALQAPSARIYREHLGLHFFYLNVGRTGRPALARVDIPAWVAEDASMLDGLHAVLVDQCRVLGASPYPYALHRAHETALVSLQEREQVTQMIVLELRRRGVYSGGMSNKQANKNLAGRARYGT